MTLFRALPRYQQAIEKQRFRAFFHAPSALFRAIGKMLIFHNFHAPPRLAAAPISTSYIYGCPFGGHPNIPSTPGRARLGPPGIQVVLVTMLNVKAAVIGR